MSLGLKSSTRESIADNVLEAYDIKYNRDCGC